MSTNYEALKPKLSKAIAKATGLKESDLELHIDPYTREKDGLVRVLVLVDVFETKDGRKMAVCSDVATSFVNDKSDNLKVMAMDAAAMILRGFKQHIKEAKELNNEH